MQSILHYNLAATNFNLLDYSQGIKHATAALQHNSNYIKALVIRGKCYYKLNNFIECNQDCELVLRSDTTDEIRNLLEKSRLQEYNKTFVKDKSITALHFKENRFNDCIIDCKAILIIMEISEIRQLLEKSEFIIKIINLAEYHYKTEKYDLCVNECDQILKNQSLRKIDILKEKALTQIRNHKSISDALLRANELFEQQIYKESKKYCNIVLSEIHTIEAGREQYKTKANFVLEKIRKHIEDILFQAKRNFKLEYFDQCIKNCEFVLIIEESSAAEELLDLAKTEQVGKKIIGEGMIRARRLYNTKHFRECIKECKKLLIIKEIKEASNLITMCETAIETCQSQTTGKLMDSAKKFYEIKNYKRCLTECYKMLNIVELKEARDLVKKVKQEKENRKYINDIMMRARKKFQNQKYQECISECEIILRIDQGLREAKSLMEKAKLELVNASKNLVKNKMVQAKIQFDKAEYEKCFESCSSILEKQEVADVKDMLKKSKIAIPYEKLTNPYEILEVPRSSDHITIKSSYYLLSMRYHPDKHSKSTKEMRVYCEILYKKITNAYRSVSK